jgi:hypothetical protein
MPWQARVQWKRSKGNPNGLGKKGYRRFWKEELSGKE